MDESAAILAEYAAKDSRIKVFTQENARLSAARNTGLEHAGGVWVTGVDSDDWLELGVYERAVVCISPGVDMVFFGVQNVVEDGTHLPHNAYFDYRFCGLPVVLIEYDMQGRKVSRKCVLWSCVKSRVKSLLR